MNVRHNDDDRPNPTGVAITAEWGSSHDASLSQWRWNTAGQYSLVVVAWNVYFCYL